MTKTIIVVLLFSLLGSSLGAQSYTLESIDQNKLRNQQLLGEYDSSVSFSVQTNSIVATSKPNWKKLDFKV
ncbi:MAG: hypothetical protein B7Y69_09355, partial [Sphingobacteriia bacterium 35-40-8]